MSQDLYKILEVDRNATEDQIKKSYRKLAMKWHPDKNQGNPDAESKFKEISSAYEILSDQGKRQQYDQFGTVGDSGNPFGNGSPFGGFNMNDIFGDFFGNRGQRNTIKRGSDLKLRVSINLKDVINGVDRKIKYTRNIKCNECSGSGGKELTNCSGCGGSGHRKMVQNTPFGSIQQVVTCNICNGDGKIPKVNCGTCKGQGTVSSEEVIDIKIPKGVENGMAFNMPQYGNWVRNGQPGDLLVYIEEIPDPLFKRENNNLIYIKSISVIDAIIGSDYTLSTPHGVTSFTVKPGTVHGSVLRIPGNGIPDMNYGTMGDLYIKVEINIPKNITKSEKDILVNLKKSNNFK